MAEKKKVMDFELLHGTHTTRGTPGLRDQPASQTYTKVAGGKQVFLKDTIDLVEIFPNKFRRIYPEQMAQQLATMNAPTGERPPEDTDGAVGEKETPEKNPKTAPEGLKMPEGAAEVTDKFPSAEKNNLKVYQLKDRTYTVVDNDDGMVRTEGMKSIIQVRKWFKDNVEDDGEDAGDEE